MRTYIRKLLCFVLILCLLLSCLPAVSAANSGTLPNSNISWSFDSSSGKLTVFGSGPMPNSDDNPNWLRFKEDILSVEIREGVTTVGPYAFYGCTNLSAVSLPDSVTQIYNDAFMFCEKLAAIKLPRHLTSIGGNAFGACSSLRAIDIPGSVSVLSGHIFNGCTALRTVTFHTGLTDIRDYAFQYIHISELHLPGTVVSIGQSAFESTDLTEIDLPTSVETIGSRAFNHCTKLKKVTIHSGLKSIGDGAFMGDPIETFIIHSTSCKFAWNDSRAFGGADFYAPTVYGYPNSTAQFYIEGLQTPYYTFKPLYFNDVAPGAWYFDSVLYAREHELFSGVAERTFAPDKAMTRAMVVQVLYNFAGNGETCENTFTDVAEGAWYAPAVSWAAAKDVVNGTGDGLFNPNGLITREQFATIIYRFYKQRGGDVSRAADLSEFPDAGSVSAWAKDAIRWAVAEGILTGSSRDGKVYLLPKANATRAQAAAILSRYHEMDDLAFHLDLNIGAERKTLPAIRAAAEGFMAANPAIRLHISELEIAEREAPPDAAFILGEENAAKMERDKAFPGTTAVPALFTPYVFAAAQGNPSGIRDYDDLIYLLQHYMAHFLPEPETTALGRFAKAFIEENNIPGDVIQQALAHPYSSTNNILSMYFWERPNADCGIALACDAIAFQEVLLSAPDPAAEGENLYCFVPVEPTEKAAIEAFVQYLNDHGTEEVFSTHGLYPLPTV